MDIAIRVKGGIHVEYGVGGTWQHAVGYASGDMFLTTRAATGAGLRISVPVANQAAVLVLQRYKSYQ